MALALRQLNPSIKRGHKVFFFKCLNAQQSPISTFFSKILFCSFKVDFFNNSRRSQEFCLHWYYILQELSDLPHTADGTASESKAKVNNFHFLLLKNGHLCPDPWFFFSNEVLDIFYMKVYKINFKPWKLVITPLEAFKVDQNLILWHFWELTATGAIMVTWFFSRNSVVLMVDCRTWKNNHVISMKPEKKSPQSCKISKLSQNFHFSKTLK